MYRMATFSAKSRASSIWQRRSAGAEAKAAWYTEYGVWDLLSLI